MVELCFYDTLDFFVFFLTRQVPLFPCTTQLTLFLVFVNFLINYCENGVCKVYYSQDISENEEDILF